MTLNGEMILNWRMILNGETIFRAYPNEDFGRSLGICDNLFGDMKSCVLVDENVRYEEFLPSCSSLAATESPPKLTQTVLIFLIL